MPDANRKSVFSLSMHKAGSSVADLILLDFCKARGMEIDRIAVRVPSSSLPQRDLYLNYQDRMRLTGVYYGIARGPYVSEMSIIKDLKTIVQVRNPCDCITSGLLLLHDLPPSAERPREVARPSWSG